jgi:ribonuclease VapC
VTIDSSAIVAILNDEPERERFEEFVAANQCRLSSVSYLESSIVLLSRRGEGALAALDTWIESAGVDIIPFTPAQARLARNAFAHFGKGRHRAGLNFGDCASYALAIEGDDMLLYQGDDFSHTDVQKVI